MLRFLEDADLVEQERDDIQRILSTDRKPACEVSYRFERFVRKLVDQPVFIFSSRSLSIRLVAALKVSGPASPKQACSSLIFFPF